MSVETWKAEYYPTPADSLELDTDKKRILHALKKFEGARPEALKKHGVTLEGGDICDKERIFEFDAYSCSLCVEYYLEAFECNNCPLDKQGARCESTGHDPFSIFNDTGNPEPMITALNKALEMQAGQRRLPQ